MQVAWIHCEVVEAQCVLGPGASDELVLRMAWWLVANGRGWA